MNDICLHMAFEEFDRIARAALYSGTCIDDQTLGAHAEIRAILCEQGVLDR